MNKNQEVGSKGEYYTKKYLKSQGLTFITNNFSGPEGEIDLIFKDQTHIYFIEVKTRQNQVFGYPEEAVTASKLLKIKKTIIPFFNVHPQYSSLTPVIKVAAVNLLKGEWSDQKIEIFEIE